MRILKPLTIVRHGTNLALRFTPGLHGRSLYLTMDDEIPDLPSTYWVAGEVAARMKHANIAPKFLAPGPRWLQHIDTALTGRKIFFGTRQDLPHNTLVHAKPAELKIPYLPADVYSREHFIFLSTSLGVHEDSLIQWTTSILSLDHEHRFFILNENIATSSPYKVGKVLWHSQMTSSKTSEAELFISDVLAHLKETNNLPPAFTLDVAYDSSSHQWIVLEANPAWSSGMYGVDMTAMIATLDRACAGEKEDEKWLWNPDVEMRQRAQEKPLMRKVDAENSFSIIKMNAE